MNAETLRPSIVVNNTERMGEGTKTCRRHPLFAPTTYTRPVIVANLDAALFVGADDLAGEVPAFEYRVHPLHLRFIMLRQFQSKNKQQTKEEKRKMERQGELPVPQSNPNISGSSISEGST